MICVTGLIQTSFRSQQCYTASKHGTVVDQILETVVFQQVKHADGLQMHCCCSFYRLFLYVFTQGNYRQFPPMKQMKSHIHSDPGQAIV